MASVRNLRKRKHSEDVGHKIVFNKYCKEGQIINDKLLPDSIQKSSYKELFTACVEELFIANIDSKQFASKLVKLFGDYTTLQVKTQNVLKKFLGKLCEACGGACKNFISTERIDKCPNCDEDSGEKEVGSEPVPKKKNKNKAPTLKRLESPRKSLRPQKAGFAASINKNCNVGKDDTNDKLLLTESIHYFKWKELFEKCVEELKQNKVPTLKRLKSPRNSLSPRKAGFAVSFSKNYHEGKADSNGKLLSESLYYSKWMESFGACVTELEQSESFKRLKIKHQH